MDNAHSIEGVVLDPGGGEGMHRGGMDDHHHESSDFVDTELRAQGELIEVRPFSVFPV